MRKHVAIYPGGMVVGDANAKRKKVAVIFGGQSTEHEVSRFSAESVIRNIDSDKYDVVMVGITKDGRWLPYNGPVDKLGTGEWQAIAEETYAARMRLTAETVQATAEGESLTAHAEDQAIADAGVSPASMIYNSGNPGNSGGRGGIDIIFPVLHGCNGEDGTIQGFFELAGIPYVGSGVLGSALGMDKAYAKLIFEKEGLPQGKYLVFSRKEIARDPDAVVSKVEGFLEYPCFVKPSNAGSSVGVTKAHDRGELVKGLENAALHDRRILVEEFIDGGEFECAILGNDAPIASTVGQVVPCNEFYDYEAKYGSESDSEIIIPAPIPAGTAEEIRDYALRAFKALDCAGLSRVDFFVHKHTGKVYINEINTIPGFTCISMYSKLWAASGIPYGELVQKLLDLAVERFEDGKRMI